MQAAVKSSILLIEDDPDLAGLIQFRLGREGYEVRHIADGEQGLAEIASGERPDLVVTDVMMPFHSGFEIVAAIRAKEDWADVPVIMLTNMANEKDVLRGLRIGASEYLTKPFRPSELVARIHKMLGRTI